MVCSHCICAGTPMLRSLSGNPTMPPSPDGWFVEPTIFTGVNNSMRIAQEEVFGPVLSVIPFQDEEEAVAIGNDVVYGLAAGVWTHRYELDEAICVNLRHRFSCSRRCQHGEPSLRSPGTIH